MTWGSRPQSGEDNGPSYDSGADRMALSLIDEIEVGQDPDKALGELRKLVEGGDLQNDWLSQDSAENALWKAIENIQFGNKTDDKLILEQLRKQGVWLARFAEDNE